jgi:hypothetical protein
MSTRRKTPDVKKYNVLVLYSWEGDNTNSKEWACALCYELDKYNSINATCDMLWEPSSNVNKTVRQKIIAADRIAVIVTANYNERIKTDTGMVSYEESIYNEIIMNSTTNNDIVFILKESRINLPRNWEEYMRYDYSMINDYDYATIKDEDKKELYDKLVRFFLNIPEFCIPAFSAHFDNPVSHPAKSFDELFNISALKIEEDEAANDKPLSLQEKELIAFIKSNKDQQGFILKYIQAGLASDLNLHGKMTPMLFDRYFMVRRTHTDEEKYDTIINGLFKSKHYNMLCIQSDGGSGKTIFIKSMSYRNREVTHSNTKYRYNNTMIDLSNTNEGRSKEEIIFQMFKKIYRRISKNDANEGTYSRLWRRNFVNRLESIKNVQFVADDIITKMYEFEEQLNLIIDIIIPNKSIIDWYVGYSRRLEQAKETNNSTLFIIIFLLYLMALDTRPIVDKEERHIIVFDNIETFDNGNTAKWISNYIQKCHSFIRSIFEELGETDSFFTKFTFVFAMRTSTALPFGNKQSDIWNGSKYIRRLEFFDFTPTALLLKLRFLERIPQIQGSSLYRYLHLIILTIIPQRSIERFLATGEFDNDDMRYFASYRFMHLFNNNFRTAMQYIADTITDDDIFNVFQNRITGLEGRGSTIYNYAINGIRMIICRQIFNDFEINGSLKTFGFAMLSGSEQHSITRVVLSYLYWSEVQHNKDFPNEPYYGILLYDLVENLNSFYNFEEISTVLYNLSIFTNRDLEKEAALKAWGNLIIYENLDYYLSKSDLTKIIENCLKNKDAKVIYEENIIETKSIYVKLSSAGMCFEQYYIRSFEFIMSRCMEARNIPALFLLNKYQDIDTALQKVYKIVSNCINKLIAEGISSCILYGYYGENKRCVYQKDDSDCRIFSCALFIRYQECMDLIKDSIDYIDRFRVQFNSEEENNDINKLLLDNIMSFYKLYNVAKERMLPVEGHNSSNLQYLTNWDYPHNDVLNKAITDQIENGTRISKTRPVQTYYCRNDEDISSVIEKLKEVPSTDSLYNAILSSLGILNRV